MNITDEARKLVDLMLAQVHATSMDVMAGISEADREQVIETLAKIRANAECNGLRASPARYDATGRRTHPNTSASVGVVGCSQLGRETIRDLDAGIEVGVC